MKTVNKYSALFNDTMMPRDVLRIFCTAIYAVPEAEREMFARACAQAENEADKRLREKFAPFEDENHIICYDY